MLDYLLANRLQRRLKAGQLLLLGGGGTTAYFVWFHGVNGGSGNEDPLAFVPAGTEVIMGEDGEPAVQTGPHEDSFGHERFRAALLSVDRGLVVVDGVFLQRPELDGCWHLRVWIDVSEAEALRRALGRDEQYHETRAEIVELYERRYQPGQRLYRDAVDPRARADVVFENEDPAEPRLLRAVHTSGAES